MILVDTNVISETLKATPDSGVTQWLDSQSALTLFFSSISLAELLLGVAILPFGRRKPELATAVNAQIDLIFGRRILPFHETAVRAYAGIVANGRSNGRTISVPDGQIAAIARTHRMTVATRDVTPFEAAGVEIINPWTATSSE